MWSWANPSQNLKMKCFLVEAESETNPRKRRRMFSKMSFPCRLHASAVSCWLAPPGLGPKESFLEFAGNYLPQHLNSQILLPYCLYSHPTLDSVHASLSNLSSEQVCDKIICLHGHLFCFLFLLPSDCLMHPMCWGRVWGNYTCKNRFRVIFLDWVSRYLGLW